jgi:hypothetical protein
MVPSEGHQSSPQMNYFQDLFSRWCLDSQDSPVDQSSCSWHSCNSLTPLTRALENEHREGRGGGGERIPDGDLLYERAARVKNSLSFKNPSPSVST